MSDQTYTGVCPNCQSDDIAGVYQVRFSGLSRGTPKEAVSVNAAGDRVFNRELSALDEDWEECIERTNSVCIGYACRTCDYEFKKLQPSPEELDDGSEDFSGLVVGQLISDGDRIVGEIVEIDEEGESVLVQFEDYFAGKYGSGEDWWGYGEFEVIPNHLQPFISETGNCNCNDCLAERQRDQVAKGEKRDEQFMRGDLV